MQCVERGNRATAEDKFLYIKRWSFSASHIGLEVCTRPVESSPSLDPALKLTCHMRQEGFDFGRWSPHKPQVPRSFTLSHADETHSRLTLVSRFWFIQSKQTKRCRDFLWQSWENTLGCKDICGAIACLCRTLRTVVALESRGRRDIRAWAMTFGPISVEGIRPYASAGLAP